MSVGAVVCCNTLKKITLFYDRFIENIWHKENEFINFEKKMFNCKKNMELTGSHFFPDSQTSEDVRDKKQTVL